MIVGWKGSATPFDFTPQELSLAADARRFELSTMSHPTTLITRENLAHWTEEAEDEKGDG